MKSLITLIFVFIIGITAHAQDLDHIVKVKTITSNIVMPGAKQGMWIKTEKGISVIYIYKNAPIKKALSFTTPRNKTRLV